MQCTYITLSSTLTVPQSALQWPPIHQFTQQWVVAVMFGASLPTLRTWGQLETGFEPPTLELSIYSPHYQLNQSCPQILHNTVVRSVYYLCIFHPGPDSLTHLCFYHASFVSET